MYRRIKKSYPGKFTMCIGKSYSRSNKNITDLEVEIEISSCKEKGSLPSLYLWIGQGSSWHSDKLPSKMLADRSLDWKFQCCNFSYLGVTVLLLLGPEGHVCPCTSGSNSISFISHTQTVQLVLT